MSGRDYLRGSAYWVDFTGSRGGEITKARPAVIVSNDAANRNLNRVQVTPLTSITGHLYEGEVLVRLGDRLKGEGRPASPPSISSSCWPATLNS